MKAKPQDLRDGLIMYCGSDEEGLRDFVAVAMKDGGVEFSYKNESGIVSYGGWNPQAQGIVINYFFLINRSHQIESG